MSVLTVLPTALGRSVERPLVLEGTRAGRVLQTYIHQSGVDVVAALAVYRDEEGEAPVGGQAVHEAVLILVPRQQRDAAVFRLRLGSH